MGQRSRAFKIVKVPEHMSSLFGYCAYKFSRRITYGLEPTATASFWMLVFPGGWGSGGGAGGVCAVGPSWYPQCPGWETHLALATGANTLLLAYPCLVLWLCSPVTFLAWLFLTLAWFDPRFGICALVLKGCLFTDPGQFTRVWQCSLGPKCQRG